MNIARWFAYTRNVEYELRRERILRRRDQLRAERREQKLIDAMNEHAGRSRVFDRVQAPQSDVPPVAIGPTAANARRALKKSESERVVVNGNGRSIEPPLISPE